MEVHKSSFGSIPSNPDPGLPVCEEEGGQSSNSSDNVVDEIVRSLTQHRDGKYAATEVKTFHVPQKAYEDLQQYLSEHCSLGGYVDDKVRWVFIRTE